MKNGTCPKCGAKEVYTQVGNMAAQEGISLKGGVINKGAAPDKYICLACGYLEYYLPLSPENVKLVRENWKPVPGQ